MTTNEKFNTATKITMEILNSHHGQIENFGKVRFNMKHLAVDMLEEGISIEKIKNILKKQVPIIRKESS